MSKKILIIIIPFFFLLFSGILADPVLAAATSCIGGTDGKNLEGQTLSTEFSQEWQNCFGLEQAMSSTGKDISGLAASQNFPLPIVIKVFGLAMSFLGIIFFLIIIVAGLVWMTAMGSSEKSEKAKEMLEAAVVGLIIVLGAYAITKFVFKSFGAEKAPEYVGQTTANADCSKLNIGDKCGGKEASGAAIINMTCNTAKKCVSECEFSWSSTGKCEDLSGGKSCPSGKTKEDNKCPSPGGNVNYKCCHGND